MPRHLLELCGADTPLRGALTLVGFLISYFALMGVVFSALMPFLWENWSMVWPPPLAAGALAACVILGGLFVWANALMLLIVFAVVNDALFVLKGRRDEPHGKFEVPRWVPASGALVCVGLIVVRVASGDWRAPSIAGALLLGILAIYAVTRPKAAVEPLGEEAS